MTTFYRFRVYAAVVVLCAALAISAPAQVFRTLVNFDGTNGANPQAALVQGIDGNFYGTVSDGGDHGHGTVFKITPSGTLTTLYSFCETANCVDGSNPYAPLLQGIDGNFYGTTLTGGLQDYGTVFKITPSGRLTSLRSFCLQLNCTDGATPYGGLLLGADGNFYGTTQAGGVYSSGTVFKITPAGALTTLHSFCEGDCTDGAYPFGGLIQDIDGNFYGTTYIGGNFSGDGTVFKMTPNGTVTPLYIFCSQSNCTDGAQPQAALVLGGDGNFYGTTTLGGTNSDGTAFKLTPGGELSTLYSFCQKANCGDGGYPEGGLIQGTDGNFYGTTVLHGSKGHGNVFQLSPAGALTVLHSFDSNDGASPMSPLVQSTDGRFYGTTNLGGTGSGGTLFRLSVGLGPFVEAEPASGRAGATVAILGTGLKGASGVSFNGASANFTVKSASWLLATVPAEATSGYVTVTLPNATLTSNRAFVVRP